MIGYLDTSAVVPLLVLEPGSKCCQQFWDDADSLVSTRLLYVETAAALAQAHRMRRLTESQHATALRTFDHVWHSIDVIEVDDRIVRLAADMAFRFGLRGYDAAHCASAATVSDDELVVAAGDRRLLEACTAAGLSTIDVSGVG